MNSIADLNSHQEIRHSFFKWKVNDLCSFLKYVYNEEPVNVRNKKSLVNQILNGDRQKLEDFLRALNFLKEVSINDAKDLLINEYNISPDDLINVKNKHQLLLSIYKFNIVSKIDDIVFRASIEKIRLTTNYYVNDKHITFSKNIDNEILRFITEWNQSQDKKINITFREKKGKITFTIIKEQGFRVIRQFTFRRNQSTAVNYDNPDIYKTVALECYPVTFKKVEIDFSSKDNILVSFSFNPYDEKLLINTFFEKLFGVSNLLDKITRVDSIKAQTFEANLGLTEQLQLDLVKLNNRWNKHIEEVKERIYTNKNLSDNERNELVNIISNTKIAGARVLDDPQIGAHDITNIVDPEIIAQAIPSWPPFFEEILNKVDRSKQAIIITVNNKPIAISSLFGIKQLKRLSDMENKAVKILLGMDV